ncbi:hypothetical protein ACG2LH_06195 [Zhouia sp. PK063]|uniref:hypothetical protein n=1 Tax=Zhouia sp. PK063 TaxID=3373602 RepID=UPI00378DAAF2
MIKRLLIAITVITSIISCSKDDKDNILCEVGPVGISLEIINSDNENILLKEELAKNQIHITDIDNDKEITDFIITENGYLEFFLGFQTAEFNYKIKLDNTNNNNFIIHINTKRSTGKNGCSSTSITDVSVDNAEITNNEFTLYTLKVE